MTKYYVNASCFKFGVYTAEELTEIYTAEEIAENKQYGTIFYIGEHETRPTVTMMDVLCNNVAEMAE